MQKPNKALSKSRSLAARVIFAALSILKKSGGEMPVQQLLSEIEKQVPLDDWAKAAYEKSGYIRWQSILHFYSIDYVKAGFLVKSKGVWFLTPEGEAALQLGEHGLLDAASKAYQKWKLQNVADVTLEEIQQRAIEGIELYIKNKNPYEFQDLAAALLRGMGYYTPFVAPGGKDGGIDILAYRDPLGTTSPRIKVQIKHRQAPASVQEVRQLIGLLGMEGDVGIFISTGGFTADAKAAARSSHVHIELVDETRFINLWQEFYQKLSDEDKNKLPLTPVYFITP
jgi:restriction system protein